MMRKAFLCLLFIAVLAATVIANAPLGFAMEQAGLKRAGLNWASTRGNWRSGAISGLQVANQPIGDVRLVLKFGELLSGKVAYDVEWQGAPGQGTGLVSIGKDTVSLVDVDAQLRLEALRYLADDVRASRARVSLQDGAVNFVDGACIDASGTVSSDVLTRLAAPYREEATAFVGDMACAGEMLEIFGQGTVGLTDDVIAMLRVGVKEASNLRAEVYGGQSGLGLALLDYGFEPSDDGFIIEHSFQLLEGVQ